MTIKTKLHVLADCVNPKTGAVARDDPRVARLIKAASYVVDKEVVDLLRREDAHKSIEAIIQANITKLPYSPMVIEYEVNPKYREIVYLEEAKQEGFINAQFASMYNETNEVFLTDFTSTIQFDDKGFILENVPKDASFRNVIVSGIIVGIQIALLMLNTRGIEKEVIEVHALNKQRIKKGKTPIQRHTIVHIGKIYRRDGTSENFHGGWKMPVHLRSGYTRNQHYGKGHTETKIIYIPPCIVNFKPDEEVKLPKKHLKV